MKFLCRALFAIRDAWRIWTEPEICEACEKPIGDNMDCAACVRYKLEGNAP